jgi:4-amino-4-deoxy-L-arabinose transferase-like glycosyltransferase
MQWNPSRRARIVLLTGLILLIFVSHLVFGLYYITHAEGISPRPSMQTRDEEFLRSFASWGDPRESDMAAYNRAALGVLETGIPRNVGGGVSVHALVYNYFLAACYWIGGVRLISVAVPQAFIAGLTALFVALAAARMVDRRAWIAGALAAALYLINLRMALPVAFMLPVNLLLLWVAIALYAATRIESRGQLILFVVAMLLAIYTQAAFFVVAAGAVTWLLVHYWQSRQVASLVGGFCIAGGIGVRLLLPHLELGTSVHDAFKAGDQGGVLWEANNPCYESMSWFALWEQRPGSPRSQWQMSIAESERYHDYLARVDGHGGRAGFLWIREHPLQYVKLCWIRLYTVMGPFTGQMSVRNRAISTVLWVLTFPAGLYGVWRLRRQPAGQLAIWVFLCLTAFQVLVITEWYLRYRMPWELMMIVFAVVGYHAWIERVFTIKTPELSPVNGQTAD